MDLQGPTIRRKAVVGSVAAAAAAPPVYAVSVMPPPSLWLVSLCALTALSASLGSSAGSSATLWASDPIFGARGDGAADFPRYDAEFPDESSPLAGVKNCSKCGGRDGCAGCLCVKRCKPEPVSPRRRHWQAPHQLDFRVCL